jgi:hypothetical protein
VSALPACAAPTQPTSKPSGLGSVSIQPDAPPAQFQWTGVDGRVVSTETVQGRITVLCFITTYDVASQAQVRFLGRLYRDHVPRLNVGVVVLEPPENREIVGAFASALELGFPVALADQATIRGEGAFRGLHHVPSVVILDREARERFRHLGLLETAPLEAAVGKVETETGVRR